MSKFFEVKKRKYHKSWYLFGKRILNYKSQGLMLKAIADRTEKLDQALPYLLNIRNLPLATGYLRDIQLAGLKMLKIVHQICQANNLQYWINYGTLIGAVRHQGFVPWDDDIDISMLRADYEKFVEIFNNTPQPDGLYAFYYSSPIGKHNLIKIGHPDFPVQLDIFPADFYDRPLSAAEKTELEAKLRQLNNRHSKLIKKYPNPQEFHQTFRPLLQEICPHSPSVAEAAKIKPAVFCGPDFQHSLSAHLVYDYDLIFPLRKISFEGAEFYTLAKPETYLLQFFGDFMSLPNKFHYHLELTDITPEHIVAIKKFITG